MKMGLLGLSATLFVCGLVAPGHCAPPSLITYQGALTNAAGSPANGTYSMTFGMYKTASGGAALWEEAIAGVNVTNGVFTVILGGTTALPAGLTDCNYLQVSVGGTPLTPRQRLTSVPYALLAADAAKLGGNNASYYRNAANLNAGAVALARLPSIPASKLASNAVTSGKIAPDAVTGDKVLNGSLTGDDIAGDSVPLSDIEFGSQVSGDAPIGLRVANTSIVEASSALTGSATGATGGVIGVVGEATTSIVGIGVHGHADGATGPTVGVKGTVSSPDGHALEGSAPASGYGLYVGSGKTWLNGGVVVNGATVLSSTLDVYGAAKFYGGYSDLAENYRVSQVEAGDVVIIGADGVLTRCTKACDTAVAGIISSAPMLHIQAGLDEGTGAAPLALVGRVPCKVDATERPIKPGDLLVSSSTPGHAMKCTSKRPAAGTVIGKALEGLEKGTGVIQVLVTLR
jgi:hypothetical protein